MAYPEIQREEIEKLKKYINKEIRLLEYTSPFVGPIGAPRGPSAVRDDWEQYGGYPGHVLESTKCIKTTLIAILANEKEGKIFPEYIVGKDAEGLKIYPYHPWGISWIEGIHSQDECLWYPGIGSLADKEEEIRKISEAEFEELNKKLVQIVP